MEMMLYTLEEVIVYLAVLDDREAGSYYRARTLTRYEVGLTYKSEEAAKAAAKRIADDLVGDVNVEAFAKSFKGYAIMHDVSIKQFGFIMAENP